MPEYSVVFSIIMAYASSDIIKAYAGLTQRIILDIYTDS